MIHTEKTSEGGGENRARREKSVQEETKKKALLH